MWGNIYLSKKEKHKKKGVKLTYLYTLESLASSGNYDQKFALFEDQTQLCKRDESIEPSVRP